MTGDANNLYQVQKKDITQAGAVLADAFQDDPVWAKAFAETAIDRQRIFFQSPVRFGLKYGTVRSISDGLEGIIVWAMGDHADMTFWRAIRCGSIINMMKMGMGLAGRMLKMQTAFKPLEADRKANMQGRSHLYLMIVGVGPDYQRQGFGRRLIGAAIEESEKIGIPLYVETSTESIVGIYEKLGFSVIRRIMMPVINLPQWEMIREPSG